MYKKLELTTSMWLKKGQCWPTY